jgi:multidrug efflux pump subunit AcrA (membrane-fusion protein)
MTFILGLLRPFLPYLAVAAVAGGIGWSGAWKIQALRLTAAEQEFVQYKQAQLAASLEAERVAQKQREDAANDYEKQKSALAKQVAAGEVWRRCVAAGRCGRLPDATACTGFRLPTPGELDGVRPDPIPLVTGSAEAMPVVTDCAATTLMLNRLQADIAAQPNY